jgi:thioredoxin reductase
MQTPCSSRSRYIKSTDGVTTNIASVFVGGDVQGIRYKRAITAAGMAAEPRSKRRNISNRS